MNHFSASVLILSFIWWCGGCVTPTTSPNFEVIKLDSSNPRMTDRERIDLLKKSVPDNTKAVEFRQVDDCPILPKVEPIVENKLILRLDIAFPTTTRVCTGFFVKSDIIATAAHCTKYFKEVGRPEYPARVYVSAGFYIDESGNPRDFGRDVGYRIIYNSKYVETTPGRVTDIQAGEDYSFIVLRNSNLYRGLQTRVVHEFAQPDFTVLGTPPISGGRPPVIKQGKPYEMIGYPDDQTTDSARLTIKRTGPGRVFRSSNTKIFSSEHRSFAGNSGGPVRESNSVFTAGIHSSSNGCIIRHVAPHEELLNAFLTAQKMSSCIANSENDCLLACCDGIVSADSNVSTCKNNCVIR